MKKLCIMLLVGIMAIMTVCSINGRIETEKEAEKRVEAVQELAEQGKTMDIVKVKCEATEDFIGEIYGGFELYNTYELTTEILENRAEEEKVIVEVAVGTVLNENLDGEAYGYYISYRSVENVQPGDTVITYFVYDPCTNYTDDIIERFDIIV